MLISTLKHLELSDVEPVNCAVALKMDVESISVDMCSSTTGVQKGTEMHTDVITSVQNALA